MAKFLAAYRATPNLTTRNRLAAYLDKHPMAVTMASLADLDFLRLHEFIA